MIPFRKNKRIFVLGMAGLAGFLVWSATCHHGEVYGAAVKGEAPKTAQQKQTVSDFEKVRRKLDSKIPNGPGAGEMVEVHVYGFIIAVALCIIGPFAFLTSLKRRKLALLIQNTPLSKVSSAAPGMVELEGKVACNSSLISPFFSKPCAFFEYMVEREVGGTKDKPD